MSPLSSVQGIIRFGDFEVDLHSAELRKHGIRIKLQAQPFQVLQMLLEHPGVVVTREELQKRIWPADTFVDFEHGLNNAVKKLREALADDADKPRFVETLSKRGYRFIAPLTADTQPARRRLLWRAAFAIVIGLVFTAILASNILRVRDRVLPPSVPRIQSLAVLPLANLSGDPDQEYFSDGMTDALITDLAQISSLKVISRTSVMRYKKTDKTLPDIARELNVDGIVEGTVQRSGDRVRITAQLVHGPSDKHIWARSYERDLRDILQLQEEVAHDVTEGISASLRRPPSQPPVASKPNPPSLAPVANPNPPSVRPGPSPRPPSPYSVHIEAYEDYLKGRNHVRRMASDEIVKGIALLERSIERDPNYAPAYLELSFANWELTNTNHRPPREGISKTNSAAMKALALDEHLAEAHTILGLIQGTYKWDWAGEERELRRGIELDPNSSFAHIAYAFHLVMLGQKTDALRETQTALELDPFSPAAHSYASFIFLYARQYDLAVREGHRGLEIDPGFGGAHLALANALAAQGALSEGFAEWLRYLSLDGDAELARQLQSAAGRISGLGDPGQKLANIIIGYYKGKSKRQYVAALTMALAYMDLGDKDKTFEWLDKAYQEHSTGLFSICVAPAFDPLRSDPRFAHLLRRMNLPVQPD